MRASLTSVLEEDRILLADGGMGTGLFALGLGLDEPPESWTLAHPDRVLALHRAFVAAGSEIVLTNTFGANAVRLTGNRLGPGRLDTLNRLAVSLARQAADEAPEPVLVAGCVGPLGVDLAPGIGFEQAVAAFATQMTALAEAEADLLWIETMSAPDETEAALEAAAAVGLPHVVTASFGPAGATFQGMTPKDLTAIGSGRAMPPIAIGANCGTGPDDVLRSVQAFRAADPKGRLVAKPSAGLPDVVQGRLLYPVSPAAMAHFALRAAATGASIIGGCCGTGPGHISAMRHELSNRHKAADSTKSNG